MVGGRFLSALAVMTLLTVLPSCSSAWWNSLDWGSCPDFSSEYGAAMEASGALLQSVPTTADTFPMALILNQEAINGLFRQLSDTSLPELTESVSVVGQSVGVSLRPELPLLSVGGQGACVDCFGAHVPFDIGLTILGLDLPRAAGAIDVQLPMQLIPEGDRRTALVAQFQSIEVTGLDLGLGDTIASNMFSAVEPLVNRLLTDFLRSEFADTTIFAMDSWEIGDGEVLLAGRGPFVYPNDGTIVLAMQSNLPIDGSMAVTPQTQLPAGADIGIVIHPGLLGAMGRRMLFEGVIPQSYDEQGNANATGSTRLTLTSIGASDDGLLRAQTQLYRTGELCGAADVSASIGVQASPQGLSLAIRDIEVSNGRGTGALLEQADALAGGFLDSLLETLEVTINYDELFAGQQQATTQMETFEFTIDGRGVTLYLDLL